MRGEKSIVRKRKIKEIKVLSGPKIGRSKFSAMTYYSELDGSPLSIASFIGSQYPQCTIVIEMSGVTVVTAHNCRVTKSPSPFWRREINKYLRFARRLNRLNREPLSYEELNRQLNVKYAKRIKAWNSVSGDVTKGTEEQ